jgi:ribosome maturation factor RimP
MNMDDSIVLENIQKAANAVLQDSGAQLIELGLVRASGQTIVRLLVDKLEGGINLDECAMINRRLGDILEAENTIPERFLLEVSSPGLDRPLKTKNDFSRNLNKKVKFFLHEAVNGKIEWDGVIISVSESTVDVDIEGKRVELALSKINKAKLLF